MLQPDVLTRVSEYVPEIVEYIKRIVANGFAYVAQSGSVYFDTLKYDESAGAGQRRYAKLMPPESIGDLRAMAESEGITLHFPCPFLYT